MDPIILEALIWASLVLSTPAIWWAFSMFGQIITGLLFPGKVVEITYEDQTGQIVTSRLNLDDDDELVKILMKAKDKHQVTQ